MSSNTPLGISPGIYHRICDALLRCGSFRSDSELTGIFVDERVFPWRNKLPQAGDLNSRVTTIVSFLYDQYNERDENAMILLLNVLRDKCMPGDACRRELEEVAKDLGQMLQGNATNCQLRVYAMQNSHYDNDICDHIAKDDSGYAELLEFSTYSSGIHIIPKLVERGYRIRLLLSHPESSPNEYQKRMIEQKLQEIVLVRDKHRSPERFEIRCYYPTAALRGRRIGNLISVSWFTYGTQRIQKSDMSEQKKKQRGPQDIVGHENAIINADLTTQEGKIIAAMFSRVFEDLWSTAISFEHVMR